MTLTFDLYIQTCPIKAPNTSSILTWRKSVQQFPRYFINKKVTDSTKNRTLCSLLRAVMKT